MANAVVNLDIRPRREPIEAVTTKLLYQRQAFVQYIPKVHKLHLGIDVGALAISMIAQSLGLG